ncbi:MAG: hypothetical protein IT380_29350 [Myxococcales bacterium]|nr:hypothetical protein [Myxococcales bacterium]
MSLEHELRGAAEKVAEGRFRIDGKRALERLKDHRFAEPSHWVLEVLRAAALSGAKRLDVRTDADDVEVTFDGRPFPAEVMKDLLSQGLVAGVTPETRRARLLGLGVAGALGVPAKRLVVESDELRVTLLAGGEVEVAPCPKRTGTHLALRKALGWRVAAAVLRGAPEAAAIRARCGRFDGTLQLNGRKVAPPRWLEEATPGQRQQRTAAGVEVTAVVPEAQPDVTELTLDVLGVAVATRFTILPGLQLQAWLRGDGFRTNASGSDVVDSDEGLKAARAALEQLSLDALSRQVQRLKDVPDDALREDFVARLLSEETSQEARAILEEAPVLPGPSGERFSVAEVKAEVKAGRPLHVAHSLYPEGSYPRPTVLHPQAWTKLLPEARQVDVAEQVQRNRRAAENRKAWLAEPQEEAALAPDEDVFARVRLDTPQVDGEVALHHRAWGAFVRLLCAGRFLQQGDVPSLAPLRLRAVVNLKKELPKQSWQDVPSKKLFSFVTRAVAEAAEDAILREVSGKGPLSEGVLAHARDLLVRLGREKKRELPAALRRAPLFRTVGGEERLSLERLEKVRPWRYVTESFTWPLLSGEPVLQLSQDEHALLKALGPAPLEDVAGRLLHEREVRRRLREKEKARLDGCLVVVPFSEGSVTGEVGLAAPSGPQRLIALYRDGFRLDGALVPSTLPQLRAAADCPELKPDERWEKAVRDGAFTRVVAVVRAQEGALAQAVVQRFGDWSAVPPAGRDYLARWAKDALSASPATSGAGRAVEVALRFATSAGACTVEQLRREVAAAGHLRVLGQGLARVPANLLVVLADGQGAELLSHLTGLKAEDAEPDLNRFEARRRFLARPVHDGRLPAGAEPQAPGAAEGVRLHYGVQGTSRTCRVEVLVEGRQLLVETLPSRLPSVAFAHVDGVEPGATFLPAEVRTRLGEALLAAECALLDEALRRAAEPDFRRVLFLALASRGEVGAPEALASRLRAWAGWPLSDGGWASVDILEARDAVCFTDEDVKGALPDQTPVVAASDSDVRAALVRFRAVRNVASALRAEVEARARRAKLAAVEEVSLPGSFAWRRKLATASLSGEVVLSAGLQGRLELFTERKPLCALQGALPSPLAAAVNCELLTPQAGHGGVVQDAVYDALVSEVLRVGEELADEVAARWDSLDVEARWHAQAEAVALLFWVAGRKKQHRLARCALLETTAGTPLSLADLLPASSGKKAKKKARVPYAERKGALLDEGTKVWRPREGELALARALSLPLVDVTPQLEHADTVRGRRKQEGLRVASDSPWREAVAGGAVQGEVVLSDEPLGRLDVQLLHEMTPLEHYWADHPVGGLAEINCDALRPNADWTKAVRNQAFRDVLAEVDRALEVLLARRLTRGLGSAGWRPWALAALRWRRDVGPVAAALPGLPLFARLDGAPATLGEVLAEHSRSRRVAVAATGKPPAGALVLAASRDNLEALLAAGLTSEDVTEDLTRAQALEASRRARRLASLTWAGQALLRVDVQAPGLKGQVALPLAEGAWEVRLAREGVEVGAVEVGGPSSVAALLDVEGLPVNAEWTEARPTPAQVTAIRQALESVFGELAKQAGALPPAHRGVARQRALEFLREQGVKSAAHLDRLTGVAASLSRAPLFHTVEGRAVSLRAVADEVLRRGKVAVLKRRLLAPDVGEAFVLEADALYEPWLEALARALGDGQVERIEDLSEWRARRAEADPPKDTPEWAGLERLRREVRLLRAGALGRLTPDELDDVRLSRAGGKTPLRYDAKRKLALLDPDDEAVRRALVEYRSRPERLFTLVAAVYGAVNRALHHLTDAHEAELLLALAGHLAANPKLLEPRSSPSPIGEEVHSEGG